MLKSELRLKSAWLATPLLLPEAMVLGLLTDKNLGDEVRGSCRGLHVLCGRRRCAEHRSALETTLVLLEVKV